MYISIELLFQGLPGTTIVGINILRFTETRASGKGKGHEQQVSFKADRGHVVRGD